MNNPANPKCNAEGYNDPTAFYGTQKIVREESETERRANELIKVLKFIIRSTWHLRMFFDMLFKFIKG